MMNLLDSTSDQADFQLIVLIVTTIYAIVCCVVLEIISLCMICQKGKENSKFQMISFGTVLVLLLVLTYLFWNCVSSSNGFEKEMTEIRETECSSNYDNLMFKNYGDTLVSGRSYNYWGMILAALSLVLTLLYVIFQVVKNNLFSVQK
ncbi:unnamed protein product [Moneuplotes crassus]|uniref:Uncharacterized protein n=1 Tax=Euplotes crassus TaxID=5936 RepID=A0AAD1U949_EUPCR|nr:unnamed protein product [Moneuplotes crassus]